MRFSVVVVAAFVVSACVTTPAGSEGARSDRITAAEIESVVATNLYEAVQRLRPRWLDVRSSRSLTGTTEVVVFQGQALLGELEVLRQVAVEGVVALRYLDAATAKATLPGLASRPVDGAIVIEYFK